MCFNIEYSCHTITNIKHGWQLSLLSLCNSGVVPTGHLGTLCHNSFRSKAATIFNCLPNTHQGPSQLC